MGVNSFDYFFYHEQQPLDELVQSEVLQTLMQPSRSLFYSRSLNSSNLQAFENTPNALVLQVGLPYEVVNALTKRNNLVSNGTVNRRDLRAFSSQDTVNIQQRGGEVDVNVEYLLSADTKSQSVNLPIGRTN